MIEQYTSPAVVNNSQEPWLVGEGVSLSGSIAIPSLDFNFVTNAFPGTVTFSRASTATYFDSTGTLQSAAINVPRLDYDPATLLPRGFLVEEQRTNSIRNNTMQGAVAGTPGTLPTNWTITGAGTGTLSRDVVGVGSANGINYVDVRYYGTTSTIGFSISFEPNTGGIAATTGQTWAASNYIALVGGSIANISFIRAAATVGRNAAGGATTDSANTGDNKAALTTTLQRFSVSATLADANTVNLQPGFSIGFSSGVAIDITLRIGLPQLELGAFATSVIPTTTTALTRSADVASVNTLSPWFNGTETTLYVDYSTFATSSNNAVAAISDNSFNNRLQLSHSSGNRRIVVTSAGIGQWDLSGGNLGSVVSNTPAKFSTGVKASDFAGVVNGGTLVAQLSGALPSVNRLNIGADAAGGAYLNGHIRRITYYPRRLSNAELQSITS